jgi:hypothetical protein
LFTYCTDRRGQREKQEKQNGIRTDGEETGGKKEGEEEDVKEGRKEKKSEKHRTKCISVYLASTHLVFQNPSFLRNLVISYSLGLTG